MSFAEKIADINSAINGVVWGVPMIILILAVGLWLTGGSGLVQFRHFGYAMKNTLGKIFKQQKTTDKGAVTPFQAVTTALALPSAPATSPAWPAPSPSAAPAPCSGCGSPPW